SMKKVWPLFTRNTGNLIHFTVIPILVSLPISETNHEFQDFVPTWFRIRGLEEDVETVDPQLFMARNEREHVAAEPDAEMLWRFFPMKTALEAVPGIGELVSDVEVAHTRTGE